MPQTDLNDHLYIRVLEDAEEMIAVEDLQRIVWPGNETEIVPGHLLLTASHNGGLVIGAYLFRDGENGHTSKSSFDTSAIDQDRSSGKLVGFVFGFPGFYPTPDGPRLKHCSHMLAVLPEYRDKNIGFRLKRAQWQMVRHQEIDRITWTYDPLLSRNAYLNVAKLGAVCNTYLVEAYGDMRDGLNIGLPSDRLQVDWWVNTRRVSTRLGKRPRRLLNLSHFLAAETLIINPAQLGKNDLLKPANNLMRQFEEITGEENQIILVEIPPDFPTLKDLDIHLALAWRHHIRELFEMLFQQGFMITDFVFWLGKIERSFYVFSYGESTL